MNSDEIEELGNNRILENLYNSLTLITLCISFLVISSFLILGIYHIDFILNFFTYFEKIELIKEITMQKLEVFNLENIISISLGLFIYFYLFEYIKQKGIMTLIEDSKESKYFGFLFSLYGFFNFIIVIPLIVYLFVKKWYLLDLPLLEFLVIMMFYLISKFIFNRFLESYRKIIFNYNSLLKLNPLSIRNEFKKKINSKYIYLTFIQKNKEEIQWLREFLMNEIILYIFHNVSTLLKAIFTLTLFAAFFGIVWKFNILSIIYIELCLIVWYYILSAFSYIPSKTGNITLTDGKELKNVYIIENSPKGYYIILSEQNKILKIITSSVTCIE